MSVLAPAWAAASCTTRADVGVVGLAGDGGASPGPGGEDAAPGDDASLPGGEVLLDTTPLAVSSFATCALPGDGSVRCWGDNRYGELGQPESVASSRTAVTPRGLPRAVVALTASAFGFCALGADHGAVCWGDAIFGDFRFAGSGETLEAMHAVTYTALEVPGLPDDTRVVRAGLYFACSLGRSGAARCWGLNERGQLGTGSTTHVFVPTEVQTDGARFRDVAPARAGRFACGTTVDGAVLCWGDNAAGQLGDGTREPRPRAVRVTGLDAAAAEVAAGRLHACARLTDGDVACWGDGALGQLGEGAGPARASAARVPDVHDAVALSVGDDHACALVAPRSGGAGGATAAGAVVCWGADDRAQATSDDLPGIATRAVPVPSAVTGSRVTHLAAGQKHTCARDDGGTVRCWGYAGLAARGDGPVVP